MINIGSYVIIQKIGGDHLRLNRIQKGQKILIEKLKFDINGAVGRPYGMFEASAQQLTPIVPSSNISTLATVILQSEATVPVIKSVMESDINDLDSNNGDVDQLNKEESAPKKRQKLTHIDIGALKQAGVSTSELISKLVDGNAAFNDRTEYSQLKYVQKKTKKHSDRVLITKPNIRLLTECYYKRSPDRIAHLRIDLLGFMLQMSAVHVGCRVFVYEQVLGLMGASIIERLGGEGACLFLHRYDVPQSIPCIYAMEFDKKLLSTFYPLRISSFLGMSNQHLNKSFSESFKLQIQKTPDVVGEDESLEVEQSDLNLEERRQIRAEKEKVALDLLAIGSSGFKDCGSIDCIVLALRTADAIDILEKAYSSLRLSGTVVVYSAVQSQVINAYEWLKNHGAVDLQVSEQFYRSQQVLPDRTHPLMQQPIAGGYVLSGVKVKGKSL